MTLKCKNPYFDENIDRKFVFLLYSVLIAKGINLGEKFDGLFISDNKVGILETHLDYEMAVLKEVSVYEAFEHCIPDGMRYNKELYKLVPDVIQWKKVDNGGNHIAFDGTPFDTVEEALNHNCTLLAISSADEYCSGIKVEIGKVINITLEDRQILDELKKSGKSYLQIINLIKNTDTFKKHNGGDGNDYYDLPPNALQLQDLIEFKNMNANIKDIFKACWRKGDKKGVDEIYDVEKMVYYSLREAGKVLNTKDYISIATRIMGKQNVK